MKKGIQDYFESIGKWACYALCIIQLAENYTKKTYNILSVFEHAITKGWIYYNWENHEDQKNFDVNRPDLFLSFLTGVDWHIRKDIGSYKRKSNELIVNMYKNDRTGFNHFVLNDWDSLQDSVTVKEGYIAETRVFTRV